MMFFHPYQQIFFPEALTSPYPFRISQDRGSFRTNAGDLIFWEAELRHIRKIELEHSIPELLSSYQEFDYFHYITFGKQSRHDPWDASGEGDEFRIFATIIAMTLMWLKNNQPPFIVFTAKEASRARLYTRFAKGLSKHGYTTVVARKGLDNRSKDMGWLLARNDVAKERSLNKVA